LPDHDPGKPSQALPTTSPDRRRRRPRHDAARAHRPWADIVRLSDVKDIAPAGPGEEVVRCDLGDRDAVLALMEGVDAVLHFGGISVEDKFEPSCTPTSSACITCTKRCTSAA
jgi:hypothetical protein